MQPASGFSGSSREGSGSGSGGCCGSSRRCSGWPLMLFTLLAVTVTAAATAGAASAAASVSAPSGGNRSGSPQQAPEQKQQQPGMYSLYHEIPRLKLYRACGLPLVLLLARKCSRRGGVYLMESDPRFAFMTAKERERKNTTLTITHLKLDKVSGNPKHLCFRRNYGLKNPFLECCCNYCTERTVLGFCRDRLSSGGRRPLRLAPRIFSRGN